MRPVCAPFPALRALAPGTALSPPRLEKLLESPRQEESGGQKSLLSRPNTWGHGVHPASPTANPPLQSWSQQVPAASAENYLGRHFSVPPQALHSVPIYLLVVIISCVMGHASPLEAGGTLCAEKGGERKGKHCDRHGNRASVCQCVSVCV